MSKTPWQKIMRAAKRGTGLRLTVDEVWQLSRDSAIETKAGNDDEEQANPEVYAAWQSLHDAILQEDKVHARARLIELGEMPESRRHG